MVSVRVSLVRIEVVGEGGDGRQLALSDVWVRKQRQLIVLIVVRTQVSGSGDANHEPSGKTWSTDLPESRVHFDPGKKVNSAVSDCDLRPDGSAAHRVHDCLLQCLTRHMPHPLVPLSPSAKPSSCPSFPVSSLSAVVSHTFQSRRSENWYVTC